MHRGPRITDIAPFDGTDRGEFIEGLGASMLSKDKRYCTQQNIDEIVAMCGEMRLQSVWVNHFNRFKHLGFTEDHYCLMRAVGWVWRAGNISEYRKMMKDRPSRDEWSPALVVREPSYQNSKAALLFMEQHFGKAAE